MFVVKGHMILLSMYIVEITRNPNYCRHLDRIVIFGKMPENMRFYVLQLGGNLTVKMGDSRAGFRLRERA